MAKDRNVNFVTQNRKQWRISIETPSPALPADRIPRITKTQSGLNPSCAWTCKRSAWKWIGGGSGRWEQLSQGPVMVLLME